MKGHIHHTYTLQCSHIVTCGCDHEIGDMAWCMACQDYEMVANVMVWMEPKIMINAISKGAKVT